jgi:hypothetical protein
VKIYCAAIHSNGYAEGGSVYIKLNGREQSAVNDLSCDLESYHYVKGSRLVNHLRETGIKVFLDSGAYSAHTLGIKLDVAEYSAYILENKDILRVDNGVGMVSVLDGIGDAEQTWQNQLEMQRLGVNPLPCFHSGEKKRYLQRYVANYEYITLGGMVGARPEQLQTWLDRVWGDCLIDGAGRPKVRVHGFGITSVQLMERYPWASCDSSSWIQSASFGVIVTRYGAVQISSQSPFRHVRGQHYTTVTDIEKEVIENDIRTQGFDVNRLMERYEARAAFNIKAFNDMKINTETFTPDMLDVFSACLADSDWDDAW